MHNMDRQTGVRLLRLLAAAIVYIWALTFCHQAGQSAALVSVALDSPVKAPAAKELFRREEEQDAPTAFCFWGEQRNQRVTCQQTGASAQVTAVLLSGNPQLVGAESLAFQSGCLIDPETAQTLFGTHRCGAQTLLYGEKIYRVLGTVPALEPTLVAMAGEESLLSGCLIRTPPEQGTTAGSQLLLRWGLEGTVLDVFPLLALTRNLLLLVPAAVVLEAGRRLRRRLGKTGGSRLLALAARAAMALLLGLAVWAFCRCLVIPPDMIPSRWSDFSFWSTWWEGQRENFRRILLTSLGGRQLQMLLNMVKSMVCSILAAVLADGAVRRRYDANTSD